MLEKIKNKLTNWIKEFQDDPETAEKFLQPPDNNTIKHYTYTVPCPPWIGFFIEPEGEFFPLEKLVVSIERITKDYEVLLRHYRLGSEKFHVGHLKILGRPTRIVACEMEEGDKLQIMIEQLVHKNDKRYEIQSGRGKLVVENKDGSVVVCPTILPSDLDLEILKNEEDSPTNGSR